jgi:hypothetical protein
MIEIALQSMLTVEEVRLIPLPQHSCEIFVSKKADYLAHDRLVAPNFRVLFTWQSMDDLPEVRFNPGGRRLLGMLLTPLSLHLVKVEIASTMPRFQGV